MSLADDYRQRAAAQRALANELIDAPDVLTNAKKLVSVIVGQVNATLYESLADTMDYLKHTTGEDSVMDRRRKILERNDLIRKAAANGDWSEFDRLTAERDNQPKAAEVT